VKVPLFTPVAMQGKCLFPGHVNEEHIYHALLFIVNTFSQARKRLFKKKEKTTFKDEDRHWPDFVRF